MKAAYTSDTIFNGENFAQELIFAIKNENDNSNSDSKMPSNFANQYDVDESLSLRVLLQKSVRLIRKLPRKVFEQIRGETNPFEPLSKGPRQAYL